MPLMHSKTPKAFKKNLVTELEHGKPKPQALAIAYSEKRSAEHKKHMFSGGPVMDCPLCTEKPPHENQHEAGEESDNSMAGYAKGGCVGPSCTGCSSPSCMSEGGMAEMHPKHALMPPKHLAEGGEMHHEEPDGDEGEIHGLLGEELMGALERKDKKAIMQCLEACIMSCMNKGE